VWPPAGAVIIYLHQGKRQPGDLRQFFPSWGQRHSYMALVLNNWVGGKRFARGLHQKDRKSFGKKAVFLRIFSGKKRTPGEGR